MQSNQARPIKVLFVQTQQPPPLTALQPPDSSTTESKTRKKRKVLSPNARDIVFNVLEMCELERSKDGLIKPLNEITSRAAILTGISEETIMSIKSNNWKPKKSEENKSVSKKKKVSDHKIVLDDRDIMQIKNRIRDYHIEHCKVPSMKDLLPYVADQIPLDEDNVKFLHRVLCNIGYRMKKLHLEQSVLVEAPSTVAHRDEYLQAIRDVRNDTNNIFYVYECVINRFYTLYKTWVQKYGNNEALSDKHTYTLICVASIDGFLKKATYLRRTIIDESSNTACGQLTADIFEKWLKENLIPHLPRNSLIVMDDGPHHSTVADKPLSYYASKREMVDYLKQKNLETNEKMRRTELFKLMEENTSKHNVYIVDDILAEHQHKVMRLPPYMIDLSPTQLAMDQIQQDLSENYGTFNLKNVTEILDQAMGCFTKEDWQKFFEKVRGLEDDYWRKDGEFEVAYDKILKNMWDRIDLESEESSEESELDEDL